jgi:tetratricopeptide (TPR) repeat protein
LRKAQLNVPEFEKFIRKAITLDPRNAEYRELLVQFHFERQNIEEAAETARHLTALYFEAGANEPAEKLSERFFQHDKYSVEFRKMLINHYLRQKNKDKAIEQYLTLIELSSEYKQKMEYYQKILSVDASRADIKKKMTALTTKHFFNKYKWGILPALALILLLFFSIVSSFFSTRSL